MYLYKPPFFSCRKCDVHCFGTMTHEALCSAVDDLTFVFLKKQNTNPIINQISIKIESGFNYCGTIGW